MRPTPIALALLVLLTPALTTAQQRGPGGDRMRGGGRAPGRVMLPASETVQKFSPVLFLLERQRVLELSSAQITQLESIDANMVLEASPLFKTMDSIRAEVRPPEGGRRSMSDEDRDRMRAAREAYGQTLRQMSAHFDSAEARAMTILTENQRKQAATMLEERKTEFARLLPGGDDRRGTRGAGRGRRPKGQ